MMTKKSRMLSLKLKSTISFLICLTGLLTLIGCGAFNSDKPKDIRVLMVGGGSSHNFDKWYKGSDVRTLEGSGIADVTYIDDTDSISFYLPQTDVLYLSNNQPIDDQSVRQAIMDFVNAGNGLILGHAALWYNWADWPEYNQKLVSGGSRGHDPYGEFKVTIKNNAHPITEGVETEFTLDDELYYFKPDPKGPGIEVLATASAPDSNETFPSVFTVNHQQGKIVGIALGHDGESHEIPQYQNILKNAIKWVAD